MWKLPIGDICNFSTFYFAKNQNKLFQKKNVKKLQNYKFHRTNQLFIDKLYQNMKIQEKSRNPLDADLWLCINFKQSITITIKQSRQRDTTILRGKNHNWTPPTV